MKMKKVLKVVCFSVLFISSSVLYAQQKESGITFDKVVLIIIATIGLGFGFYQWFQRVRSAKKIELAKLQAKFEFEKKKQDHKNMTDEEQYRSALKEELGTIDMLGSPDIESKTVKLEDAFVSLCISEDWRGEERFKPGKKMKEYYDRHLTPEQAMERAFQHYRLFLIIGDPGSGKTTLLKYYAISCLNKKYREFGFNEEVFPIYFPLRELTFENHEPVPLPRDLAKWSERHLLNISEEQFHNWLHNRKTLVLLDGMDEISDKEHRRKVCRWVKDMCAGLKNAFFAVTSRSTGYRKLDGIELESPHLRTDIMDFTPEQQEVFLKKWFRAVFLSELPPEGKSEQEWKEQQLKLADQRSQTISEFLKKEENKTVQELAVVPMLLQIMAMIWKERDYLPKTRLALYEAALNYLLEYRDRQKKIKPALPAEEARRVLTPTALWMQEQLKKDEVLKTGMYDYMRTILNTLTGQPDAVVFCENLRDRSGLIADYDKDHYIFRHKSFREFLSALQLVKDSNQIQRIQTLVEYFKEDWWEETLRFFMSKADDEIFDRFMRTLFKSEISQELDAHQQTLLQNLVKDAPQRKIDALAELLNSDRLNDNQRRYIMDCLKTIGTPEVVQVLKTYIKKGFFGKTTLHAMDIVVELIPGEIPSAIITGLPVTIRNPFEDNVEYIKISGGTYRFSVSKEMVTVPDLYFCKFPVTNKRYRRFISFLAGKEKELLEKLPMELFAEKLLDFSKSIDGYTKYVGKNPQKWQEKLRSRKDDDKKFKGDDQPVVGVTWYAARAYCFWLSCLETVISRREKLANIKGLGDIFRLPTEMEWERAAGGNPDDSIRDFPWPKEKGEPNPMLANYNQNVGATTPVGRYPEGATLHGLMDMAGNVWEWMENLYKEDENWRALRGGALYSNAEDLRCSARSNDLPGVWSYLWGFRVVRAQS